MKEPKGFIFLKKILISINWQCFVANLDWSIENPSRGCTQSTKLALLLGLEVGRGD